MEKKLLKDLLEINAVSGKEESLIEYIKEYYSNDDFEYERDNLGSLYYIFKSKKENAKTILIDAHIDEVGFYVTSIEKNGLIRIENHGGIQFKNVVSQNLTLVNKLGKKFHGIVLTSNEKELIENLYVDFGFENSSDVIKNNINIGDQITFNSQTVFNKNRIIGKSIDNRVGTYIVMDLINYIKNNNFDFNIVIGFSTQEEVGLRGARASAYKFNPDIAMVVDISPIRDFTKDEEPSGILGGGTMLRHKDAYTIYSRNIVNFLRKILIENKIKYQNYISLGGTNAGIIQLIREGVPVIPIGLVSRNMHSNSGVFDKRDLTSTIKLTHQILNELNSEKIDELKNR